MVNKIKCKYIYERGTRIGEICGKETQNDYCSKHTKIKEKNKNKDDNITIISTIESEEINEKIKSIKRTEKINIANDSISMYDTDNNDDSNENILLTKYFVFDCIKEFFKDHQEIEGILGKKSSGSSFGGMGLAGIALMSLAPILLKNLSGINIENALYRQESTTELCSDTRLPNNQSTQGNYTAVEREKTTISTESSTHESGNDKIPAPSYLESIKGPKI